MGCMHGKPVEESEIEKCAHVRRKTQHLIQNLVHEEFRLKVEEVYDLNGGKILGTGISGMVRVVKHLTTGELYAMKTLHLNRLKTKASLDDLRNEVAIMSELDHPNIVQLYETFETQDHIFLIMELCTGGELLDKLHRQEGHHYSEKVASQLVKKMVGAIRYCHEHNIAHRDLKLENFLFENDSQDAELKLIDFGLSRHYRAGVAMHRPVGTPYYVAPEVLEGSYTQECDLWSIGVITYMLVSGRPPFFGKDDSETLARVRSGQFTFPSPAFDRVSDQAKDFIRRLLVVDHRTRMTARTAQEHPWLHGWDQPPQPLSLDLIGSLRQFHQFSTMKKIALEVVAFTLRPEQIKELRREFEKVDVNSNGEITIEALSQALAASGLLRPEDLEHLVKDLDTVHTSGTISWHEFLAATMDASLLDEEHIRLAFERIDTTHAGYVTKENFAELCGVDMSAEQVEAMFAEVDLDRDGRLNYPEFAALMKGTQPSHDALKSSRPSGRHNKLRELRRELKAHASFSDLTRMAFTRKASTASNKGSAASSSSNNMAAAAATEQQDPTQI